MAVKNTGKMSNITKCCKGFEAKGQRNVHVLSMKGYNNTTTLENNWATASKGEDALWSRNSIPRYIIQKNCKIYPPEDMNRNMYSSAVCKEKKCNQNVDQEQNG